MDLALVNFLKRLIYLRNAKRGRDKEIAFPLPKCLKNRGFEQAEARSQEIHSNFPCEWHWSHGIDFALRSLSKSVDSLEIINLLHTGFRAP